VCTLFVGVDQAFQKYMGQMTFLYGNLLGFVNCVIIGQLPGGIAKKRA